MKVLLSVMLIAFVSQGGNYSWFWMFKKCKSLVNNNKNNNNY